VWFLCLSGAWGRLYDTALQRAGWLVSASHAAARQWEQITRNRSRLRHDTSEAGACYTRIAAEIGEWSSTGAAYGAVRFAPFPAAATSFHGWPFTGQGRVTWAAAQALRWAATSGTVASIYRPAPAVRAAPTASAFAPDAPRDVFTATFTAVFTAAAFTAVFTAAFTAAATAAAADDTAA